MAFLATRYPALFQRQQPPVTPFDERGFEIGDGWYGIVDRLAARLVAIGGVRAAQVKEKFGALRVHLAPTRQGRDVARACFAVVDAATAESVKVCEVCGAPGELIAQRWWRTRCAPCRDIPTSAAGVQP